MNEELELNKKLVEFAEIFVNSIGDEHWIGLSSEDKVIHLEPFTQSLSACFKWLTPLIEDKGLTLYYVSFRQTSGRYYAEWKIYKEKDRVKCGELLASDWQVGADLERITALALCLVVEKLIDEEAKSK